jgi:hypothetical protein
VSAVLALAGLGVLGAVLYGFGRSFIGGLREGGRDAARAERARADLRAARRQGEIMVEQRSVDDVAKDLDAGRF